MRRIVLFEPLRGGHRAGFIRWISREIARIAPKDHQFVFYVAEHDAVVPSRWVETQVVPTASCQEIEHSTTVRRKHLIHHLFVECCRQYRPDHVLIGELTLLEGLLIRHGAPCPVSALVFVQYPELRNGVKFLAKHLKTTLLLRRVRVRHLFFLNGNHSCTWLSQKFRNTLVQFIPIPDPASDAQPEPGVQLRAHYGIDRDRAIFLFFGAISRRKGADVLLRALERLPSGAASRAAFLFCGKPESRFHTQFEVACAALARKRPDLVLQFDLNHIPDARMAAWVSQTNAVLMPYLRPEYSSGILATAARFSTPVIGPQGGLLGRLILENGLGTVCRIQPGPLAECIALATSNAPSIDRSRADAFAKKSHPSAFARELLEPLIEGG